MPVVEGHGQGLGFAQAGQDATRVAGGQERGSEGQSEVEGQLAGGARVGQMRQGFDGLLEQGGRLAIGRARHGLAAAWLR